MHIVSLTWFSYLEIHSSVQKNIFDDTDTNILRLFVHLSLIV